jgi:hypothetical protein
MKHWRDNHFTTRMHTWLEGLQRLFSQLFTGPKAQPQKDTVDAFSNTICQEAEEHGLQYNVVRWIYTMLKDRKIVTAQTDSMMRVFGGWGCAWCGDWWPMGSWVAQQTGSVYTRLCWLHPLRKILKYCLRALEIVQRWCRANKLSVNPDKTETVIIIKRKKTEESMKWLYWTQQHYVLLGPWSIWALSPMLNWLWSSI